MRFIWIQQQCNSHHVHLTFMTWRSQLDTLLLTQEVQFTHLPAVLGTVSQTLLSGFVPSSDWSGCPKPAD